jgi:hypothetical protein
MIKWFTEHPATIGETYFSHLFRATAFGVRMLIAGIACILHGLFPFLCVTTGSDAMKSLHDEMSARRDAALKAHTAPKATSLPIR